MSEMSDTPRTDGNCWTETGHRNGEVVLADFARQLERELAAKAEECERMRAAIRIATDRLEGCGGVLAALKEAK